MTTKTDRTFVLVCLNFCMLFVLFCGLGYVLWQSATLVGSLRQDLDRAEQTVAELRVRIQGMDIEVAMDRVAEAATRKLKASVDSAVGDADFPGSVRALADKVDAVQGDLVQATDSIRALSERLEEVDAETLGQTVSYHTLKGLGEGFTRAAEARPPPGGN